MATSMTKTTKNVEEKSIKKKFNKDDMIPCRSITNGELFMTGPKSGELYSWADYDDITEVSYEDLTYDIRSSRTSFSTTPRFIILDEDFVSENQSKLEPIYDSLYSTKDLRDILSLQPAQIKKVCEGLPKGALQSLKGVVGTMVSKGTFDSVTKLKVLDEIFGTQMLQLLVN